ncbi:hypothetical protein OTB20_11935 [Streptomyces sp. H27-H1]|uniref:hypothetical protein n=1 Tax=Streptomyces sp. H27-H1 TaxID=2996461 RepID=UPI00226E9E19|nr:hypothetical protein [Streptomyces sp. H27-H1]MCY0926900.1 hypothetical protein [Streptomyces sp. H27-H1]
MEHHIVAVAEVRDLEPEDGWVRSEKTGRACIVCPCGLNTGFVTLQEAHDTGRAHAHDGPFARPVTFTVQLEGAGEVLAETIKRALDRE